jgi:hypothetical protein
VLRGSRELAALWQRVARAQAVVSFHAQLSTTFETKPLTSLLLLLLPPPRPPSALHPFSTPQDQFDSIDLSDNAIVRLEGFPRLPRLKVLLLNNNRIAKIGRSLEGE